MLEHLPPVCTPVIGRCAQGSVRWAAVSLGVGPIGKHGNRPVLGRDEAVLGDSYGCPARRIFEALQDIAAAHDSHAGKYHDAVVSEVAGIGIDAFQPQGFLDGPEVVQF